jgi:sigma-B regulation protein RsbU (phosphoserine phosphatase)
VKFREYEIQFREGDMLFVYTDGVAEAENTEKSFFTVNGTVKALNMNPKDTPKEVIDYLYGEIARFAGDAEQSDDITMLCFRYKRTPNE